MSKNARLIKSFFFISTLLSIWCNDSDLICKIKWAFSMKAQNYYFMTLLLAFNDLELHT